VAGRLQDPGDTVGGEDAVSHNEADDVASNGSFFLRLLTFQHEQLCVGRENFVSIEHGRKIRPARKITQLAAYQELYGVLVNGDS
jgi:hypothetical protein